MHRKLVPPFHSTTEFPRWEKPALFRHVRHERHHALLASSTFVLVDEIREPAVVGLADIVPAPLAAFQPAPAQLQIKGQPVRHAHGIRISSHC
jgi:hypothetical protein